jgi:DNA invertase Pin-like site-specific DNA recombinase
MTPTQAPKALLYARVSTAQQASEGLSLEGQERTLREAAEKAGYSCELFTEGGKSGKSMTNRPALLEALELLNSGKANALYFTKLDRLARTTKDLLEIADMATKHHWRLVALDGAIDTETPTGKLMLTLLGSFAEFERGLISARHKETHATRRAQGVRWGIDKGNTPETPLAIRQKIINLNASGVSLNQIARELNAEGAPTTRGGAKWYASTVRAILKSPSLREVA